MLECAVHLRATEDDNERCVEDLEKETTKNILEMEEKLMQQYALDKEILDRVGKGRESESKDLDGNEDEQR